MEYLVLADIYFYRRITKIAFFLAHQQRLNIVKSSAAPECLAFIEGIAETYLKALICDVLKLKKMIIYQS